MMKLKIWGGAGEHGRSAYVLSGNQTHLLLDCGVKREGAGEYPLIELELVPRLDAVFLSHAHEDHSLAIPLLYRMGYRGEIWTTRETASQVDAYFKSWRLFIQKSGGALPYEEADYRAVRYRFLDDAAAKLTWFKAADGVEVMWGRSGHMAGAVWLLLRAEGKTMFYSGDYTAESLLLESDSPGVVLQPGAPATEALSTNERQDADVRLPLPSSYADLAIIDAAYGTDADSQQDKLELLSKVIKNTLHQGGNVLLPVPATGRAQEMLLWAGQTFQNTPIVTERELIWGMERLLHQPEWLRSYDPTSGNKLPGQLKHFLQHNHLRIPGSEVERRSWLNTLGASIWFITDGMMQSPLARWYYEQFRHDSNHLVLLTGHASRGTFAEQLLRQPKEFGACAVKQLNYKVHQGIQDVRRMLSMVPAQHHVLVHAAKDETDRLRSQLLAEEHGIRGQIHSLSAGEELGF